ncbi:hypothetical protein EBR21_17175, partial [bacterium]|nr:hypothetical protein [bacterium]
MQVFQTVELLVFSSSVDTFLKPALTFAPFFREGQNAVNLFARILCKIVEVVLHVRTFLIHGPKIIADPTWLLVNCQSDAQLTATEQ